MVNLPCNKTILHTEMVFFFLSENPIRETQLQWIANEKFHNVNYDSFCIQCFFLFFFSWHCLPSEMSLAAVIRTLKFMTKIHNFFSYAVYTRKTSNLTQCLPLRLEILRENSQRQNWNLKKQNWNLKKQKHWFKNWKEPWQASAAEFVPNAKNPLVPVIHWTVLNAQKKVS